jgi:hypothetical protein
MDSGSGARTWRARLSGFAEGPGSQLIPEARPTRLHDADAENGWESGALLPPSPIADTDQTALEVGTGVKSGLGGRDDTTPCCALLITASNESSRAPPGSTEEPRRIRLAAIARGHALTKDA